MDFADALAGLAGCENGRFAGRSARKRHGRAAATVASEKEVVKESPPDDHPPYGREGR